MANLLLKQHVNLQIKHRKYYKYLSTQLTNQFRMQERKLFVQTTNNSKKPKFTQNVHLYVYTGAVLRRIVKLLIEKKKSYLLGMTSCIKIYPDTKRLKSTSYSTRRILNNSIPHNARLIKYSTSSIFLDYVTMYKDFSSRELFLDSVRCCQKAQNAYRSSTRLSSAIFDVLLGSCW